MARSACVVGATGGIGQAVLDHFARQDYDPLTAMARQSTKLDDVAKAAGAIPIACDLADPASIEAAFSNCGEIDVLVLCSGVVDNGKLGDLTLARWNEVLAINLTGFFLCCHHAYRLMRDGGRIITIGSLAGRTGGVLTGTAYAASKAGLEGMTKSIAQQLASRSILVNCVAPGATDTPMLDAHTPERLESISQASPLKRLGLAEEMASCVAWLASPDCGYITGTVIPINGGVRMD